MLFTGLVVVFKTEAKVDKFLVLVCLGLSGCASDSEQKPILLTPVHYRLAESLCKNDKGLVWIQFSPNNPKEFQALCHNRALKSFRVIL
jgi:hypothetical protein